MSFELHPILAPDVPPRPGFWYAVAPESSPGAPAARVGACAIRGPEAGTLYISAGATPEGAFSDLHQLKISSDSLSWSSLPSPSLPPRYEHTLASCPDGKLMVFAGAQESGPLNDMWMYDWGACQWSEREIVSGSPPSPRTHHSSSCMWRETLVVFSGGQINIGTTDNDIHIFNTVSSSWYSPPTAGNLPSSRQGHIAAVVGDTLFVHGGMAAGGHILSDLHSLALDSMVWSEPITVGLSPPSLAAHGCAVIGVRIYIFGGLTPTGASDILYCLNTDGMEWGLVGTEGAPPPCRLDLAMCSIILPPFHLNSKEEAAASSISAPETLSKSSDNPHVITRHSSPPHTVTSTATPSPAPPTQSQSLLPTLPPSHPHFVTVISPDMQIQAVTQAEGAPEPCGKKDGETVSNGYSMHSSFQEGSLTTCGELRSHPHPLGTEKLFDNSGEEDKEEEGEGEGEQKGKSEGEGNEIGGPQDGAAETGRQSVGSSVPHHRENVSALVVFGGMDTCGHIHNDCFLIVPQ